MSDYQILDFLISALLSKGRFEGVEEFCKVKIFKCLIIK